MRLDIPPCLALLLVLACANAGASSQAQVQQALADGNYAAAGSMIQSAPPGQHRATLLAMAKQNLVPAQWLLAGDHWRGGEIDKAVSWAFTARMGTLLDSSSCSDRRAEQVDRYVANSYRELFLRSGSDPAMEQRALRVASAFHQQAIAQTMDPQWTCRYWAAIDPQQRPLRPKQATQDKMLSERKRALQGLLRRGRIDLGIPKKSQNESDPIKRNLVPAGVPKSWISPGGQ